MESNAEYVAPLNLATTSATIATAITTTATAASAVQDDAGSQAVATSNRLITALKAQLRMTPPLTPHSSREEMVDRSDQGRSLFHNYLRAFYPFHPDGPVSSSTVTLPLDQGDVILVHSVHTNGWADGTLLETGARGWLPTNYCEAYDPQQMHPLLKALMDFWDVIRGGNGSTLHQFSNQDYMRGMIAGVRFLLEKSECLTRDCRLVKRVDGLRRNRKALLSDLSSLVKLAKQLQDIANGRHFETCLDNIFDLMLLKAFRIVTRGVRFLDVWSEEVGLVRALDHLDNNMNSSNTMDMFKGPLTPPVDGSFNFSSQHATSSIGTPNSSSSWRGSLGDRSLLNSTTLSQKSGRDTPQRPASVRIKRPSLSHRISYSGHTTKNPNLASGRLTAAHDEFLGVLGSFIGLHLQSPSSTELIVTTQEAVQSCKTLLSVVEEVWERDLHRSFLLERSKNTMYDRIAELVNATQNTFRTPTNPDDETIFVPGDGKRLVDAATDCVRGAGDCVSRARTVLEQIGDFELENIGLGITMPSTEDITTPTNRKILPEITDDTSTAIANTDDELSMRPLPLQIPDGSVSSISLTPSSFTDASTLRTPTSPFDESFSSTFTAFTDFSDPFTSNSEHDISKSFHAYSPTKTTGDDVPWQQDSAIYIPLPPDDDMDLTLEPTETESTLVAETPTRPSSPASLSSSKSPVKEDSQTEVGSTSSDGDEDSLLETTYAHELMFKDGQVTGGSLRALVEKLTCHESTPDALFVSTFYLTFRHFTTPVEFAETLIDRYDYIGETPRAGGPVRLRVYNVFKGWLEAHWRHDVDDIALPSILNFARTKLIITLPTAGKRLIDLVEKVSSLHGPVVPRLISSVGKTNTSIAQYVSPDQPLPQSNITKSQLNLLKQWKSGGANISILDFDPLEIARQITIKESQIFCSILPEELLSTEWMKKTGSLAVNVRAMSTLSTDIANLVADSILQLEEPKKRAVIVKRWVKIASKCLELNNYDTLMAIICSLNSSTISRLKRTWEIVPIKTKNLLESLREIVDVSRNYAVLRQRLQNHVPPCLPFVGTYLTDLTFVDHGNHDTRTLAGDESSIEVINFDKHMKTAKIISELQRFQIPYRLREVPELQTWIQDQLVRVRSAGDKSFQQYYRRSLVLEPRERAVTPRGSPTEPSPSLFAKENTKEKFDFLAWTHSSKLKVPAA
ncbi:cell division control protein 25 [Nannizzia gypsea CBS 118893]|uniref:Cell division control protein 25 n=1 Tax=Arthroderma gypseum (strain ATCC MYA-4604 / CBS 118893) TaxID=535722 RepID=E5R3Y2_ARTGP|nr:cell division control protein 25 [Nannizzia gypsea CBS 118893]EFQ98828.1 cell division control protein 25 [Nannizzia gypsea CBS 118893]